MMKTYDIFDFDHTIYDGDSSLDFYLFCLRNKPNLIKYLPIQLWHAVLFVLKLEERKEFKENFFSFLCGIADVDLYIEKFWQNKAGRIKDWYISMSHSNDIIISASPEFLLDPLKKKFGFSILLGTRMNKYNGKITGENCRAQEKVNRLVKVGDIKIDRAYSNSLLDRPMLTKAKRAFIVKGNNIYPAKL